MGKTIDLLEREAPNSLCGGVHVPYIYADADSFERWVLLANHARGEQPLTDKQLRHLRKNWGLDKPN